MATYQGAVDDSVALAQALIRCQSITPKDDGALDIVESYLNQLGFTCHRLVFGVVNNVYAKIGEGAPTLCFAGHTDVVPPGDLADWDHPPFEGKIIGDYLYGRGASDMKGAVAAFMVAASLYLKDNKKPLGSISLLITGDEEAEAIDGTQKVLAWMQETGETIDDCLVGEPSNLSRMGETIKIGRRGSINMDLTVHGQQGHAANPHLANNPIPAMAEMLAHLDRHVLDEGTEDFIASNLELTSVDTGNGTRNIIPANTKAQFNIRYNTLHTAASLDTLLREIIDRVCANHEGIGYQLDCHQNGDPFLTQPCEFSDMVRRIVKQHTGRTPQFATNGGTSDARYIKNYARVVEFGLTTETIHKTNECASVENIRKLTQIYHNIICDYFND